MKYYKFKKITKGENPIIRVTYKTWHGSLIEKDICKSKDIEGVWEFMEDGSLTHRFEPINNFYKNDEDVYWVNGA
tara:strand:- start:967 stop:1191 length:225 start_codon:yes stop_codon:yes gene_type:complete